MKADKEKKDKATEMVGKVVLKKFGEGSKSEHDAVCLQTEDKVYKLKRAGGNPFVDPQLQKLAGKKIKAVGQINDYLFTITEYKIIR